MSNIHWGQDLHTINQTQSKDNMNGLSVYILIFLKK